MFDSPYLHHPKRPLDVVFSAFNTLPLNHFLAFPFLDGSLVAWAFNDSCDQGHALLVRPKVRPPLYLPMSKRQQSPPPRVRRQITRPSLCSNMKSAKSCVLPMPTSYQLPENIARLWYNLCYGDFRHRSKRPATKWGISFSHPKNG